MSDRVEAMAKILFENDTDDCTWEEWLEYAAAHPSQRFTVDKWRQAAAAALTCTADIPSEDALEAGLLVLRSATHPDKGLILDIWQAVNQHSD